MKCFRTGFSLLLTVSVCFGPSFPVFAESKNTASLKFIIVDVDSQKMAAMDDYKAVYIFDVVTGRPGKETITGKYKIFKKYEDYTSKKYDVPMPYSMFFSEDGKAIHGTEWATVRSFLHSYITESVGSQGCVGLAEEDAKTLFAWAPVGTPVVILDMAEEE
jgi:lipoprotein-anchoring transpeptidase ErfK/SrfK